MSDLSFNDIRPQRLINMSEVSQWFFFIIILKLQLNIYNCIHHDLLVRALLLELTVGIDVAAH